MAGSARSGTAAWLPRRPDQAPLGGAGPRFVAGSSGLGEDFSRQNFSTQNFASRRFRHGSEIEPDPDPPLEPGARIGERHRVVELLGEGGMGRVYAAEHVVLARKVAIKLLRGDAQASADSLARFQQEALTASRIGAPQIVEVIDFASHVGVGGRAQTYMVMELLVGESLEAWMDRPGSLAEGLALLAELCEGLAAAHRAGVVHRDIKPANVFVRQPAAHEATPVRVKILDFGIAKVTSGAGEAGFQTQKGSLLGTPYYLAPERVLGETLTSAADVYSVGVILYEMLTGDVPFVADSFMAVLARHVQTIALDPRQAAPERGIPDRVASLCMRLLAKQPSARGAADAVAHELRALLADEGASLIEVSTGPRAGAEPSRADTQLLADPSIHERPTAAPRTGALVMRWPAGEAAPAPAAPLAPTAPQPRARSIAMPVAIGVALALVLLVGLSVGLGIVGGTRVDGVEGRDPEPGDPASASEARIEIAAPIEGLPVQGSPVEAEVGVSSAPAPLADASSGVEGAGLAPAGEASSPAQPEPALARPGPSKPQTAKPKPPVVEPASEPAPQPEPPKPKPIEDQSVPTIKDDIYD